MIVKLTVGDIVFDIEEEYYDETIQGFVKNAKLQMSEMKIYNYLKMKYYDLDKIKVEYAKEELGYSDKQMKNLMKLYYTPTTVDVHLRVISELISMEDSSDDE